MLSYKNYTTTSLGTDYMQINQIVKPNLPGKIFANISIIDTNSYNPPHTMSLHKLAAAIGAGV